MGEAIQWSSVIGLYHSPLSEFTHKEFWMQHKVNKNSFIDQSSILLKWWHINKNPHNVLFFLGLAQWFAQWWPCQIYCNLENLKLKFFFLEQKVQSNRPSSLHLVCSVIQKVLHSSLQSLARRAFLQFGENKHGQATVSRSVANRGNISFLEIKMSS